MSHQLPDEMYNLIFQFTKTYTYSYSYNVRTDYIMFSSLCLTCKKFNLLCQVKRNELKRDFISDFMYDVVDLKLPLHEIIRVKRTHPENKCESSDSDSDTDIISDIEHYINDASPPN